MRRVDSGSMLLLPLLILGALVATSLFVTTHADDEVQMAWKKPEGQASFDAGKVAYGEKKFKEAYDAFRAARKFAKDRPTKVEVDRWTAGAQGGNELDALKKRAEEGRAADAHTIAEKNYRNYANTPIGKEYKAFIDQLERELFTVLENFDSPSKRYSEKYGKTFIDDPEMVQQGRRCLKWEVDRKSFELKISRVPSDLSSFADGAVVFWLYFDKGSAPYQLVFNVPGKGTAATGARIDNAYLMQMKAHKGGWKRIEVPLKRFTAQGDVEWNRVKDFRIQFLGGKRFTCYVDAVMLRK